MSSLGAESGPSSFTATPDDLDYVLKGSHVPQLPIPATVQNVSENMPENEPVRFYFEDGSFISGNPVGIGRNIPRLYNYRIRSPTSSNNPESQAGRSLLSLRHPPYEVIIRNSYNPYEPLDTFFVYANQEEPVGIVVSFLPEARVEAAMASAKRLRALQKIQGKAFLNTPLSSDVAQRIMRFNHQKPMGGKRKTNGTKKRKNRRKPKSSKRNSIKRSN
jgi:hypothetical protein